MPRPLPIKPGDTFNRLTAVEKGSKRANDRHSVWVFDCSCGTRKTITAHRVVHGVIKSCGCLSRETASLRTRTHGQSKTPTHNTWMSMHCRCRTPKQVCFRYYGGKGIRVCDRWSGENGYINFLADMGEKPGKGWSIDRIDPSKDYEPSNCRWLTLTENIVRMRAERRAQYLARTHCVRGHEFTNDNSYFRKDGTRICKKCNQSYALAKRDEQPDNIH
jgi:hypothetical protein